MTDNRLLLKPAEVAERLGLAKSTIYMLAQRGELPAVRIGASVRIPLAALQRWVAEHTDGADDLTPSGGAPA